MSYRIEGWQRVCQHLAENGLEIGDSIELTPGLPEPGTLVGFIYIDEREWQAVVQLEDSPKGVLTLTHYSRVSKAPL